VNRPPTSRRARIGPPGRLQQPLDDREFAGRRAYPEKVDVDGEDLVEPFAVQIGIRQRSEIFQRPEPNDRPARRDVSQIPSLGLSDSGCRPINRGDRPVDQSMADQRDRDTGPTADLQQMVTGCHIHCLDCPTRPLRSRTPRHDRTVRADHAPPWPGPGEKPGVHGGRIGAGLWIESVQIVDRVLEHRAEIDVQRDRVGGVFDHQPGAGDRAGPGTGAGPTEPDRPLWLVRVCGERHRDLPVWKGVAGFADTGDPAGRARDQKPRVPPNATAWREVFDTDQPLRQKYGARFVEKY
jgi:hypothetical protein